MYEQNGFGFNPYNDFINRKRQEKRELSSISCICGGALAGFSIVAIIISSVLQMSDSFIRLYESNSVFEQCASSILTVVSILLPFFIAYSLLKEKRFIGELPLGSPYDRSEVILLIPICMMVCIIGNFATGFISVFFDSLFGIEFTQPEDNGEYTTAGGVLLSVLLTAVVPALVEEFAIRGVVLQSLRKYGDGFAIVMSSVVFALMHGNMVQIPFAFIAGLALGYAVIKTGSMWTGIIIHFLNNLIAVVTVTAYDIFSETVSSIISYGIYAVIFAVGIICALKYTKKNPNLTACLSRGTCGCLSLGEKVSKFIFTVPMLIAIGIMIFETSLYISVR